MQQTPILIEVAERFQKFLQTTVTSVVNDVEETKERIVVDVMRQALGREPNIDDFKKVRLIRPVQLQKGLSLKEWLFFDGMELGILITLDTGIYFEPVKDVL